MKTRSLQTALLAVLLFAGLVSAPALHAASGLAHDEQSRGAVPIPPSERFLQTAHAELWFKVSHNSLVLEGAIFDTQGNLFFCDVSGKRVLRLPSTKQRSSS